MEPYELLRKFVDVMDRLQVRYLVTGSVATITYGDPRFTNDIDIVVELGIEQVDAICTAFSAPEYYCSRDAVEQAIRQRFQFNILHFASGMKIDVFIPTETEFDRCRFDRRVRVAGTDNLDVWFASPEDVIIKKMASYKEGQSEKHIRDILGVLKVRAEKVDRDYIATWAERMQLTEIWLRILQRLDKS